VNKTYLLDYVSLDMIGNFPCPLTVNKIDSWYFCSQVNTDITLVNAIRRKDSAKVINDMCDTKIKPHRRKVKLKPGDVMLVISIKHRLPKEYTLDDLAKMIESDKISLYEVLV
jgi:predicted MarR family transcription regulator